jgi:hypothetical protein
MENRFIILIWRGNGDKNFIELFDSEDMAEAVNDIKQEKDVEFIEVITLSEHDVMYWRWSKRS